MPDEAERSRQSEKKLEATGRDLQADDVESGIWLYSVGAGVRILKAINTKKLWWFGQPEDLNLDNPSATLPISPKSLIENNLWNDGSR